MRVVDTKEMKEIKDMAVKEYGFTESLIAENVGIRGADFIQNEILSQLNYDGEIVALIGSGNNAADGLSMVRVPLVTCCVSNK